jgi:hypothetical protein
MQLTKSEALAAVASGETLVGSPRSQYPGEVVEHKPHVDVVDGRPTGHPDVYAWHVVGRPDHARLRVTELVIR